VSEPNPRFSTIVSSTNDVREDWIERVAWTAARITLTSSMRRQTTQTQLCPHREPERLGIDVGAVAPDHPSALEIANALRHGLARQAELLGEVGAGAPAFAREQHEQPSIHAVEIRDVQLFLA